MFATEFYSDFLLLLRSSIFHLRTRTRTPLSLLRGRSWAGKESDRAGKSYCLVMHLLSVSLIHPLLPGDHPPLRSLVLSFFCSSLVSLSLFPPCEKKRKKEKRKKNPRSFALSRFTPKEVSVSFSLFFPSSSPLIIVANFTGSSLRDHALPLSFLVSPQPFLPL